jgi:hypothetical protein
MRREPLKLSWQEAVGQAGRLASNSFPRTHALWINLCRGLLVGGVFMDPKTAQTVTTVLMLTLMLVGGYYVRNVPVWISWLKYLSFMWVCVTWASSRCGW